MSARGFNINDGLVLCFPYRGVAGIPVLFLRIAEYLADHCDKKVVVIDYIDGFIRKNLSSPNVAFFEYRDDREILIGNNATVILQSITPWSIYPKIKFSRDTKLFFWNCHPFNLIPAPPLLRLFIYRSPVIGRLLLKTLLRPYLSRIRAFVGCVQRAKAIAFMDGANVQVTNSYLGTHFEAVDFLPIPSKDSSQIPDKALNLSGPLRAAWVGRIADFKVNILAYTLISLAKLSQKNKSKISFTVIGDGPFLPYLKKKVTENEYFSIRYICEVPPSDLDGFLNEHVDILFAMGTSALEGMKLGIPTVLLNFSYRRIRGEYIFEWASNSRDFSLGEQIGNKHFKRGNTSLSDLMDDVKRDYRILSKRMLEYYYSGHSMKSVALKLINYVEASSLTYGTLSSNKLTEKDLGYRALLLMRGLLNSMFSIRKSWIHKMLRKCQ